MSAWTETEGAQLTRTVLRLGPWVGTGFLKSAAAEESSVRSIYALLGVALDGFAERGVVIRAARDV